MVGTTSLTLPALPARASVDVLGLAVGGDLARVVGGGDDAFDEGQLPHVGQRLRRPAWKKRGSVALSVPLGSS